MELTQWPRLIVVGDPVTREQANEVLIRSNSPNLWANDKPWMRAVCAEFGVSLNRYGDPDLDEVEAAYRELGVLDLHYLTNHRIVSTWSAGPYGWCDWDGRIGCNTYNIGKRPDRDNIQRDLDLIVQAWPFLRMDLQLIGDEGEGDLLAMWQVRDGQAVFVEPGDLADEPFWAPTLDLSEVPHRERGLSLERLREALARVRALRPSPA